jgi:hypothetical protein
MLRYAHAGDVASLKELHKRGYRIFDPAYRGTETYLPPVHLLVKMGKTAAAADLIATVPDIGDTEDA